MVEIFTDSLEFFSSSGFDSYRLLKDLVWFVNFENWGRHQAASNTTATDDFPLRKQKKTTWA